MTKSEQNIRNNLIRQLDSLKKHCNEKSYATRERYYDACCRFCDFLAKHFRSQKFANIQRKHITAYVEHLQDKGISPATIQSDLAGIRFYHRHAGGKNKLPENSELHLERRSVGVANRAWLPDEISKACRTAQDMKRNDVLLALRIGTDFGLRIHEIAKLRTEQITDAIKNEALTVKGKGGQVRAVPVETEGQKKLLDLLEGYVRAKKLMPGDYLISQNVKYGVKREIASLQNWLSNNGKKFADEKRAEKVGDGRKPRMKNLSWHGLRYYYAQQIFRLLTAKGVRNVDREISRRLGHHRGEVTKIYLE